MTRGGQTATEMVYQMIPATLSLSGIAMKTAFLTIAKVTAMTTA